MKILISNDDGINSSGLLASKNAVETLRETLVVAPSKQQSGIGRALTLFEPLRLNQVVLKDESIGYSVSGTPTDSVTLGLFELMDEKPDLCISGINIGENIGKGELTTSGTLGAAMEAASYGIPTIAISQEVTRGDFKFEERHLEINFENSKRILYKIAKKILDKSLPKGIDLLNINVPSNPANHDLLISKLGKRMFVPKIKTRLDPRGTPYYWIDGTPYNEYEEKTDGYGLHVKKQATITPLSLDLGVNLDLLKDWI
ncbi:MAG: 5'/3'-nucleotidase SurE [Methanobrevibacter sp.]|jgi:5'-nucleotidase|nr:5'/3'-nucleotidase SurE [Candidatus Methanovirga basalitermitum]